MITVEKLEKGTYFDDAFKISFRYDPTTVAKVKELAERRYLPEDRAWEIPAHELPALIEKVGLSNIKSEEAVVQALNTKEIEDKREATQERLKGIKPVRDFDFKTAPLPHQIEAFNYGMEKNSLLIGDEQGLGKTKESIDICVARKKELIKTLIVCGVNSVKYNWEKEIQIHSNEGCVMVDGKTMDVRVQQLNDWYRGSSYFGVINIESLRNEKIQDALYLGIKDGYIGAIIVDEIHKAKNGGSQQGKALRFLKAPVKIGLSGTPMNKAEDLWNILTWLGVERRSFYSFRNAYCTMGGFGGYKVIGYKNLDSLNAELNTVMLRRKKEEVLDLPPKLYSTEYVELTTAQKKQYRDIKNGIVADMENILASVNPLNCTLRLRQLTSGNPNLTDDSPKLDRIKEMLEEEIIPNGHKAIIFSQWSTIAKDLGIELSEYDPIVITGEVPPEQRQKLVDNFQTNPHCKVAIGTIGAMGTGLTLNKASYVFFMDKAWNSGDNAQAEDRAHRIGTVGAVNVISMVAKGTIDEAVEDYLLENKDLIDRVVDGKKRCEVKGLIGIPTGIPKLDEITNGWLWGEDLVVLTGRTNVGKTWIGEYFATMAWNMGYKILMYSGEMSTAMVGFRFDTLNKHFSNMGLLNGSGTLGKKPDTDGAKYLQEDYEKYITQLQQKSGFIVVTPDDFEGRKPNVDEIKSLAIKHGADMIVIDQLSLMSDKRRADIPRIAYNNISEDLFLMSKELKKPVLLMAQANREAVKNRKKGESPELHDLAESDGVGQNATRVLSLSVIDGTLKISVKKNRYGINNKEVLMIWEVNTGYLKPLLSENPEESIEDKKDDKSDGEKDKGGEKDYGF